MLVVIRVFAPKPSPSAPWANSWLVILGIGEVGPRARHPGYNLRVGGEGTDLRSLDLPLQALAGKIT